MIDGNGLQRAERINRTLTHKGVVVDFYADTMKLPDGRKEQFDFIMHKGAAAVVPVFPDGRILLVKQYRNALDMFTLELPAGAKNFLEEPTNICAQRELEEETGYRSELEDVKLLVSIYTTVALCNEKIDIYLADNLKPSTQNLDDDEYIDVCSFTLDEIIELIFAGDIVDSKTVAGILAYKTYIDREAGSSE